MPHQPRKVTTVAFLPGEPGEKPPTFPNTVNGLIEGLMALEKEPEMHFVRLVCEHNGIQQNLDIHSIRGGLQVQVTVERPSKK